MKLTFFGRAHGRHYGLKLQLGRSALPIPAKVADVFRRTNNNESLFMLGAVLGEIATNSSGSMRPRLEGCLPA